MRRTRRILRFGVLAFSLLFLGLGALFGVLQTGWGKSRLASLAGTLASSEDLTIEISGIEGFVPSDMRIGRITASDSSGAFAEVDDVHLTWSPLALLGGEISVRSAGAARVSLSRKPDLPPSQSDSDGGLPGLRIAVDDLSLPQIELGTDVLGTSAKLALSGSAALREPERGLSAQLDIRRLDGDGLVTSHLSYVPTSRMLVLDVAARESTGGLIARLLEIEDLPPVELKIAGEGTLDAFRADIAASAGERGSLSGIVRTEADGNRTRVLGELRGDIARLVPDKFAAFVDGISEIDTDLRIAEDLSTEVTVLTLRTAGVGVSVAGDIAQKDDRLNLAAKIHAAEPSVFAALLPDVAWSDLSADVRISGAPGQPEISADIAAEDLIAKGRRLSRVSLAAASRFGADGALAVSLDGRGRDAGRKTFALKGALGRESDGGLSVRDLNLSAFGAAVRVNGRIAASVADLTADISADLAQFDERLAGRAEGTAKFSGGLDNLDLASKITIADGTAMGEPIQNLSLDVNARDLTARLAATAALTGFVGGRPVDGKAVLTSPDDVRRHLESLTLEIGSSRIDGTLALNPAAPVTGEIRIDAPDLSELSAFALKKLGGTLKSRILLTDEAGVQTVELNADAADIAADDIRVASARAALRLHDPQNLADIQGSADIVGVAAGSTTVESASLTASPGAGGTDITLKARAQGADISAGGLLESDGETRSLTLNALKIAKPGNAITLKEPARFVLDANGIVIDNLLVSAGSGSIKVLGHAGQDMDLTVELSSLPLSLAQLVDPSLPLTGSLSGKAEIKGPANAPEGSYRLTVSRLSLPDLARSGVGPLDIKAEGQLTGGRAGLDLAVSGPSLSGVSVKGSVPIADGQIDLAAKGTVGLGLANATLAASGARLSGSAVLDIRIGGTKTDPRIAGTVRVADGKFEDTVNGITLDRIAALAEGDGKRLTLSSLTAHTRDGGTIAVEGQAEVDPARGFPGSFSIRFTNATLIQSEFLRFVTDGTLSLEGELASRPRVNGRLDVRTIDFIIPERMPGGLDNLEVRHVNAPDRQKRAAAKTAPKSAGSPSAFTADLDLVVSAPNNVFVRGMGMESELGGEIRISGTSANPTPLGAFDMRRGRFDVMGKRLDFTRGKVDFTGTLDPSLDFVASTAANDVTANIVVGGLASAPEISFTSTPALPQDEVIARLMFGRSSAQLTAGQALQVAQTIMQFSGGGPGVMDGIRQSLGVDSLDVGTGEGGKGGQIGIGKRLNDRIYFGVKQGTEPGSTKATIDIDITRNIRAQGATNPQGGSEVGIGAQWDY